MGGGGGRGLQRMKSYISRAMSWPENNHDLAEKLTFGKLISKISSSNKNELYNILWSRCKWKRLSCHSASKKCELTWCKEFYYSKSARGHTSNAMIFSLYPCVYCIHTSTHVNSDRISHAQAAVEFSNNKNCNPFNPNYYFTK